MSSFQWCKLQLRNCFCSQVIHGLFVLPHQLNVNRACSCWWWR